MGHLDSLRMHLINIGTGDQELILAAISYNDLSRFRCRPSDYLELLFDVADSHATIVMNAFTWRFCETAQFDINRTPVEVGLVAEIFRRTEGVLRSRHPIFSLCAKGPLAREVLRHNGPTCWGNGSPAQVLLERNAFCLNIGKEFPRAITLLHSFEEWFGVPYRYFKTFSGEVNFGDGAEHYATEFYVRDPSVSCYHWTPAVNLLLERSLIRGSTFDLPIRAAFAQDLQRAVYQCLEKNSEIFITKDGSRTGNKHI